MKLVADDVQGLIIPDCGHWLAEEAPEQMLAALTAFLGPHRDASRRITEHRAVVTRSRTAACYERVTHPTRGGPPAHDQAHTLFAQTMGYVTATAACSRLAPTWAVT